jgi:hypothetical protein
LLPWESFLCLLGRCNILNQQPSESLPVPTGAAIVLAALLLKNGNRSGPPLSHDFSCDLGPVNVGLAYKNTVTAMYDMDFVEFNLGPDISRQPFDLDCRACFNSILFAAC